MDFAENVRESLRSISSNLLRTVLTGLIIAVGITSLVGIMTAIDAIGRNVQSSFSSIGANTFDITAENERRGFNRGRVEKDFPRLELREAIDFKDRFSFSSTVSIYSRVTGAAEVKYHSETTNPNVTVVGADENYLINEGLELSDGRNLTPYEAEKGSKVAVIGSSVANKLFGKTNPIDKEIGVFGTKFKVVGLLEKKGSSGGGDNADRTVIIPLDNATRVMRNREPVFSISVNVNNPAEPDAAIAQATGDMRIIRKVGPGRDNNFTIKKSTAASEQLGEITGYLRLGALGIGAITLLGASIALMNIMMVTVTERTREIGVRKALGATPKKIRIQFLTEAISICILGGLLGIILGVAIGNGLAILMGLEEFILPWVWMIVGIIICVIVGLVSGVLPAYQASRLDPIESLRYE